MSIILIGYRGSGKTTLGRSLAQKLRVGFIDLDDRITESAGMTIKEIFAVHGQEKFRQLESEQLLLALTLKDHVISLGGGAVLAEENRRVIARSNHTVVFLTTNPEELHRRIFADPVTATSRPGLTHLGGSIEEVRQLLSARMPLYNEIKHIELDVTEASIDILIERLVQQMPK